MQVVTHTAEDIIEAVCEKYGLQPAQLLTPRVKSKTREAIAKQVICYLMRKYLKKTCYRKMVLLLGYGAKSQGIITHNCKLTIKVMDVDNAFRSDVDSIEKALINKKSAA